MTKTLTKNAVLAALYAAIALLLPATPFANYRLTTALYVLAAWNPNLIPGLAIGNALAGLPQGPLDMLLGAGVGLLTSWACSKAGKCSPLAVLIIPTLLVPLWLGWLYGVPYGAVVPVLATGQAASAALGWLLMRSRILKRLVTDH
jgi:uncharacterized membrane protein